jgi:selenocysteine lyase/cysteine desulfurase
MYDIDVLRREQFPFCAELTYLNHASVSPLPQAALQSTQRAAVGLSRNPESYYVEELTPMLADLAERSRCLLNAAKVEEIVPITTTSAGLSAVASAIPWQEGDNVVFCELEFPSNAYPWMSQPHPGVEARIVPARDGGLTLDGLLPYVDERTRVVAASAIQFFTGHRTNLAAVGAFCRERGIFFVVDAIQSLGHMVTDVQAMKIDVLASGGMKSLLSLPGIGLLYVREEVAEKLQPRPIGPGSTRDYAHWLDYDLTPLPAAQRFGMGIPNLLGLAALHASLHLLEELGLANIDRHTTGLSAAAIAMLERLGYDVITPAGHGPIVTFCPRLDDAAADAVVAALAEQQIMISKRWDARKTPHLRLSFHAYNTMEELQRFEEAWHAVAPR